ncbi:unnamed protein product [Cuscuta campestris]|uniref:Leucine-rich repeat-containing N-terminal plant-type domain-containing protein n=1 Tax=Cuscuta campestris TaxID=132261 RepID=A0A484MZ69_9ASTE|nr:unnamed protein product [Cuscuta campestris]
MFPALVLSFLLLSSVAGNTEVDALMALKTKLFDPNNVLQSWDGSLNDPCTWFHVSCNNNNKLVSIDLGKANLAGGELVPELGKLEYLQNLSCRRLSQNKLSGNIPAELGNLPNLDTLELHMNNLGGPIPSQLGNLQKLQTMRLNLNKLTGNVPQSFANLNSLTFLDLTSNALSGTIHLDHGAFLKFTCASFVYGNPGGQVMFHVRFCFWLLTVNRPSLSQINFRSVFFASPSPSPRMSFANNRLIFASTHRYTQILQRFHIISIREPRSKDI